MSAKSVDMKKQNGLENALNVAAGTASSKSRLLQFPYLIPILPLSTRL